MTTSRDFRGPKKILIFGAGGFIGGCLARAAVDSGWSVTAASYSSIIRIPGAACTVCDITDAGQVDQLFRAAEAEAVVNLAARANIDQAEVEREATYSVNVAGAGIIAHACADYKARLVHFSTDAVFDGSQDTITENDSPKPINYYGWTKAAGDSLVMRECPQAVILRVSLALGYPVHVGNSFLAMLKTRMQEGVEVFAPEYEIRTPIDIHTLCTAALEVAQNEHKGFLNIGAVQSVDRYTLTVRLAQRMGYDAHLVRHGGPPLPGRAPRHKYGILDVRLAQQVLKTPMLNLDETITRAVL